MQQMTTRHLGIDLANTVDSEQGLPEALGLPPRLSRLDRAGWMQDENKNPQIWASSDMETLSLWNTEVRRKIGLNSRY